jgi:hypothetical protein
LAALLVLLAGPATAHPGRTAADGCHYCRTNCASWGEVEGARHCHGNALEGALDEPAEPVSAVLDAQPAPIQDAQTAESSENGNGTGLVGLAVFGGAGFIGWRIWKARRAR